MSDVIKLVVFGGRDFCYDKETKTYDEEAVLNAFKVITKNMSMLTKSDKAIVVIDGEALGADTVGYRWGQSCNYVPERYPAQWHDENGDYNPRAGFERNTTMVECGTHFIGFWDGVSNGTKDTIKKVLTKGAPLRVYKYETDDNTKLQRISSEWLLKLLKTTKNQQPCQSTPTPSDGQS